MPPHATSCAGIMAEEDKTEQGTPGRYISIDKALDMPSALLASIAKCVVEEVTVPRMGEYVCCNGDVLALCRIAECTTGTVPSTIQ